MFLSWSLGPLETEKLSTPLPSKMPFSILSPLLIRVELSFMFHLENGLLEALILPATLPFSWKKVLWFLALRYVLLHGLVLKQVVVSRHCFETNWSSLQQDPSHWELVNPLPSYGRGIEVPGKRYRSLINGYNLQDVVITGLLLS